MKWVIVALLGFSVVGSIGAFLLGQMSSATPAARHVDSALGASELETSPAASSSGAIEEVRRLRAELRQKNALLSALASEKQAAPAAAPSEAAKPPEEQNLDPVARAVDILDERMFLAPADARKAQEMERAVREAVDAVPITDAKVASLYCTSALCKVTLAGTTNDAIQQSLHALIGKLSKTISNTAVYELSNGESAMYLAQSSEALDVPATN